jgi:hypothetical protein
MVTHETHANTKCNTPQQAYFGDFLQKKKINSQEISIDPSPSMVELIS